MTVAEEEWRIDIEAPGLVDPQGVIGKALDALIDAELKLLAIYDNRQASADARTTALATAAIGLPTLILGVSKSFASNALLLKIGYAGVIVAAFIVVAARSWNAWRRRRNLPGIHISSESKVVAEAGEDWQAYQHQHRVDQADPIRVKQLELRLACARG